MNDALPLILLGLGVFYAAIHLWLMRICREKGHQWSSEFDRTIAAKRLRCARCRAWCSE